MARISIKNLPKNAEVSGEELKAVMGGWKVEEGESFAPTGEYSWKVEELQRLAMLPVGSGIGMVPRTNVGTVTITYRPGT